MVERDELKWDLIALTRSHACPGGGLLQDKQILTNVVRWVLWFDWCLLLKHPGGRLEESHCEQEIGPCGSAFLVEFLCIYDSVSDSKINRVRLWICAWSCSKNRDWPGCVILNEPACAGMFQWNWWGDITDPEIIWRCIIFFISPYNLLPFFLLLLLWRSQR